MISIIICGAGGKMGSTTARRVISQKDMRLVGAVEEISHPWQDKDIGRMLGGEEIGVKVSANLEEVVEKGEVIIEFTTPQATLKHLRVSSREGKAMVIGTTGFTSEEEIELRKLAKTIPCVIAPNLSVGMNVLFKTAAWVTRLLGSGYDVEIVETHHRFKKDAPSGTARRLAEIVARARGLELNKVGIYGRQGWTGERTLEEIGIHALRMGDVVGEHRVIFGGMGERLELIHRAHSRDAFAQGALRAARFALDAPPGIHDMAEVLRIEEKEG